MHRAPLALILLCPLTLHAGETRIESQPGPLGREPRFSEQCRLRGSVRGTVVYDDPQLSFAVVSTGLPRVFYVGDRMEEGAFLRDVSQLRLVVQRGEEFEVCKPDDRRRRAGVRKRPERTAATFETGPGEFHVPRRVVDHALADMADLFGQARALPAFRNGKQERFKLLAIRPNSLVEAVGVENGDVITRVNGYPLDSPDRLLELFARLRTERDIVVDVRRRGRIRTLRYMVD